MKGEHNHVVTKQSAPLAARSTVAAVIVAMVGVAVYFRFGQEMDKTVTAGSDAQSMSVQMATPGKLAQPMHAAGAVPGAAADPAVNPVGNPRIEINTQAGKVLIELYPEAAPKAVSELIALAKSGYYDKDVIMQARPQLGFAIAKTGSSIETFTFQDEANALSSRRGSVAISKASVSNAYLNNLFFGYAPQPELEKHYVIIGQVLQGLDKIERSQPDVVYQVDGFRVIDGPESNDGSGNVEG